MKDEREIKYSKKLLVALIVILVFLIILNIIKNQTTNKYVNYRLDEAKKYVYTKYHSDFNQSNIPYINIKGKNAKEVNKKIVEISKEYLKSTEKNKSVTYRYNQNKDILSVVLIFKDLDVNDNLTFSFKTYVFDLDDNCKLLNNDEILKLFSLSYSDVNESLKKQFQQMYLEEAEAGYIEKRECNFKCFLGLRGINNYIDNASYYIENGNLVVYRSFEVYTIFDEQDYFTKDDFKFIIN